MVRIKIVTKIVGKTVRINVVSSDLKGEEELNRFEVDLAKPQSKKIWVISEPEEVDR